MLRTYIAVLAALLTAQQYLQHGWSVAVLSALFWILVFALGAGARRLLAFARAAQPKTGGRA